MSSSGTGNLRPSLQTRGTAAVMTSDYIRVPTPAYLPVPLASDGFVSTFGTTDGAGHAETSGVGSGGSGLTWTQQVGTWTVSSNRASASALSGSIAIATVPTGKADVLADVKVTRSAGQGGLVLRYTDANNYLYANHDGTNAFIKQVLAGVTTTLITAAATYSANAVIRVDLSGVTARLYYNNAFIGSTASINAALTATAHGLYVTDVTANLTVDDFVAYSKGTGGEYATLDTIGQGYTLTADQGSFTLTTQSANILRKYTLVAAQASFTLSAQAANVLFGRRLIAIQDSYALTLQDAGLYRTALLAADHASFATTAQDAGLFIARLLTAIAASYTLAGQTATLDWSGLVPVVTPDSRIYIVPFQNRTFTVLP
jgi:hypothetical protein